MSDHSARLPKSSSLVTLLILFLVVGAIDACASSPPQARLADGSLIASSADYHPPKRMTKNPWGRLPEIANSIDHGTYIADLVVGKDGTVRDVRLIRGLGQPYDKEFVAQLSTWRFEPATLNGNRVAVLYRVRYTIEHK